MLKKIFWIFCFGFIVNIFCFGANNSSIKNLSKPTDYVLDQAGMLSGSVKNTISLVSSYLEQKTGAEIAVVTINSLDGVSIEEYAVELYKIWGIGKKGKDNGVLLLVSKDDRKVRIEVGYGFEGILNDRKAGEIIREVIVPNFKLGDFDRGIFNGFYSVVAIVAKDNNLDLTELNNILANQNVSIPNKKQATSDKIASVLGFLIIMFVIFGRFFLGGLFLVGGGGYWSGGGGGFGSGGGSFGGFGGGGSGGGGASGGW